MLQVKEIEPEICPICSRAFRRSDIEAHVNECLDSKPSAKEPPLPKAPEYRSPDKPLNLDRLLNNIHAPKMPAVSKQPSPGLYHSLFCCIFISIYFFSQLLFWFSTNERKTKSFYFPFECPFLSADQL